MDAFFARYPCVMVMYQLGFVESPVEEEQQPGRGGRALL